MDSNETWPLTTTNLAKHLQSFGVEHRIGPKAMEYCREWVASSIRNLAQAAIEMDNDRSDYLTPLDSASNNEAGDDNDGQAGRLDDENLENRVTLKSKAPPRHLRKRLGIFNKGKSGRLIHPIAFSETSWGQRQIPSKKQNGSKPIIEINSSECEQQPNSTDKRKRKRSAKKQMALTDEKSNKEKMPRVIEIDDQGSPQPQIVKMDRQSTANSHKYLDKCLWNYNDVEEYETGMVAPNFAYRPIAPETMDYKSLELPYYYDNWRDGYNMGIHADPQRQEMGVEAAYYNVPKMYPDSLPQTLLYYDNCRDACPSYQFTYGDGEERHVYDYPQFDMQQQQQQQLPPPPPYYMPPGRYEFMDTNMATMRGGESGW